MGAACPATIAGSTEQTTRAVQTTRKRRKVFMAWICLSDKSLTEIRLSSARRRMDTRTVYILAGISGGKLNS
jgi:hypothetical protein